MLRRILHGDVNRDMGAIDEVRVYQRALAAGDIMEFAVDFPNRSLNMEIRSDNSMGASRIFIPADRLYPDGFTVTIGEVILICNPLKNVGLEVIDPGSGNPPSEFIWDPYRQQLIVLNWPGDQETFRVTIQPGIYQKILPR